MRHDAEDRRLQAQGSFEDRVVLVAPLLAFN